MRNSIMKVMGALGALVLGSMVVGPPVPYAGSFLASTAVSGTNAFWLGPAASGGTFTTNLGTTNCYTVELSGASSMDVMARYVNVSANGNTNNGALYLHFVRSLDGVNFETVSNGFTVAVPAKGTTENIVLTNIGATVLGNAAYVRLALPACTNIGGGWITNVTYRFQR